MKQIKASFPATQWIIIFLMMVGLMTLLYFGSQNIGFSQSYFVISPAVYSNDLNSSKLYKMKPRSIFTLSEMLRDKNWEIRERAAYDLWKTKDYRAVDPLIAALKDKDPGVRWTAVRALGEIGNKKTFEPLFSACTDPENETNPDIDTWVMRERILQEKASAQRSGNAYEGTFFSGVDIQREAVKSLLKIDRKEAKKRLIPLIEKQKRAGVLAAMEMNDCSLLGDLFDLLEVLDSETPEYWRMIRDIETALQRMACPGIIQRYLFGKLFEHEERVLQQAVKSMDPDTVLAAALPALKNQNNKTRKRVLELLYSIWDVKAKKEVVRLLDDKDPEVSDSALHILAVHEDPSLKKFYIKKLRDRSQVVRETAAESLLRMGDLRAIGLLMASESSCHNAECLVQWLGDLANEEARQILLGFLRNRNTMDAQTCTRAYHAALKLGELNEKRAIPYLTKMLQDGNGKEKDAARIALIKMGDTRFMREVLSDLASTVSLKSVQHYMQTEYLDALQEMATPQAAVPLAKLFQSGPHWQDWGWGMDILNTFEKCFAKPLIPILQEQLENPIYSIRIKAAEILAHANDSAANTALMAALANKDPQINKIALDSLGAKNLIPAQQLIQLIREEQNWLIASSALAILKRNPVSPSDLQALIQIKNKPYLIRHQLKRMIESSASTKEISESQFMPNSTSIMILDEKGIRQLAYNNKDNEYKSCRSGKLAGYNHALRTNNFLFACNNHLITRLDHEFHPEKSMPLTRIGACVADQELLYISADGQLIILNEELIVLGRMPLGIYSDSGKIKNAHDIVVQGNTAYLLDNISHPVFILRIDVSDPSQPKRIQETEIEYVNHHLDAQWIKPEQNEWRVIQSSISMGGACQWLLKFSLISGKLKDRILLFRDIENVDSWRRIDGWVEAVDPQSPEWMVIRKDSEYFLGRLSMGTGELLKQGLLPLGMHSDLEQGGEGRWVIKHDGDLIYIIRDFRLWVFRIGEKPEILVFQKFDEKILDIVFPDPQLD